jgi:hypothetical protein
MECKKLNEHCNLMFSVRELELVLAIELVLTGSEMTSLSTRYSSYLLFQNVLKVLSMSTHGLISVHKMPKCGRYHQEQLRVGYGKFIKAEDMAVNDSNREMFELIRQHFL